MTGTKLPLRMWDRDDIQFARLISEAGNLGLFNSKKLQDSMDANSNDINELVTRADEVWNNAEQELLKEEELTPNHLATKEYLEAITENIFKQLMLNDFEFEFGLDNLRKIVYDVHNCEIS